VTYHGGNLLTHVEVQALYYGSEWVTDSTAASQVAQLDGFLHYIANSPYTDMLTKAGYGVGGGSSSPGDVDQASLDPYYYLDDSTIQAALQQQISSRALNVPDSNRLYVVYVEPGVVVRDGIDNYGNPITSQNSFLGYHGAFGGYDASGNPATIRYAVIPYPGAATNYNFVGNLPAFDSMTSVTSHEFAEGITDPDVNYSQLGWYDDTYINSDGSVGAEIGDITDGQYVYLNGYAVQTLVDQNDNPINPTPPVQNPPPFSTQVSLVVYGNGDLYQYDASGTQYLASGVRSASVAVTPSGSRVYEVVFGNGDLYQYDASGAQYLCGGVQSASVAITSSGSRVYEIVFNDGNLYQFDSAGSHYMTNGVQSASVAFTSSGPVYEIVFNTGVLYQYSASGTTYVGSGVQSVTVAVTSSGSLVYAIVLGSGDLYKVDASGVQYVAGGVLDASVAGG